jgi:hypothetical protein
VRACRDYQAELQAKATLETEAEAEQRRREDRRPRETGDVATRSVPFPAPPPRRNVGKARPPRPPIFHSTRLDISHLLNRYHAPSTTPQRRLSGQVNTPHSPPAAPAPSPAPVVPTPCLRVVPERRRLPGGGLGLNGPDPDPDPVLGLPASRPSSSPWPSPLRFVLIREPTGAGDREGPAEPVGRAEPECGAEVSLREKICSTVTCARVSDDRMRGEVNRYHRGKSRVDEEHQSELDTASSRTEQNDNDQRPTTNNQQPAINSQRSTTIQSSPVQSSPRQT